MDPTSQLEFEAPAVKPGLKVSLEGRLRRAAKRAVLWLHRQADRFDLIPAEFGQEAEVDTNSARSVAQEWLRQLKLWMAYNPEEMLAIKAGAVALGVALIVLVVIVGAVS